MKADTARSPVSLIVGLGHCEDKVKKKMAPAVVANTMAPKPNPVFVSATIQRQDSFDHAGVKDPASMYAWGAGGSLILRFRWNCSSAVSGFRRRQGEWRAQPEAQSMWIEDGRSIYASE